MREVLALQHQMDREPIQLDVHNRCAVRAVIRIAQLHMELMQVIQGES